MASIADPVANTRRRLRIGEGIEGAVSGAFGLVGRAVAQKLQGKQLAEAQRRKNELALKMMGIEHADKKELQGLEHQFRQGINQDNNLLKQEIADKANASKRENTLEGHQVELLLAKIREHGANTRAGMKARNDLKKAKTTAKNKFDTLGFNESKFLNPIARQINKDNKDSLSIDREPITSDALIEGSTKASIKAQVTLLRELKAKVEDKGFNNLTFNAQQEITEHVDRIMTRISRMAGTNQESIDSISLLSLKELEPLFNNYTHKDSRGRQTYDQITGQVNLNKILKDLSTVAIQNEQGIEKTNLNENVNKGFFSKKFEANIETGKSGIYGFRKPALIYNFLSPQGSYSKQTFNFATPNKASIFGNWINSNEDKERAISDVRAYTSGRDKIRERADEIQSLDSSINKEEARRQALSEAPQELKSFMMDMRKKVSSFHTNPQLGKYKQAVSSLQKLGINDPEQLRQAFKEKIGSTGIDTDLLDMESIFQNKADQFVLKR